MTPTQQSPPLKQSTMSSIDDSRLDFDFSGIRRYPVSLDPREHPGDIKKVREMITKTLSDIDSEASFFPDEIDLAAEVIVNANVK